MKRSGREGKKESVRGWQVGAEKECRKWAGEEVVCWCCKV